MGWTPQVDSSGKVSYIDTEGDEGSAWDYITKHLPRAVSETWGEAITPSLNAVGGEQNAQDYIARNAGLTNQGGESIPEALLKGAGEGALGLVVPKASADLQGSALAQGSGALLAGAGAARGAQKGAEAGLAARNSARAKFKAAGNDQYLASRRAGQKVANASDPAGVANPMGKTQYRGPRPSAEDVEQFHRGTGLDRGIPPRELPELDKARTSARAWENRSDPVKGHQLKMAKYRAKREQLNEGLSKMKKEQLGEGVAKMKSEQLGEGVAKMKKDQLREGVEAMSDEQTRKAAERYLYNRATSVPVDEGKMVELGMRARSRTPNPMQRVPEGIPNTGNEGLSGRPLPTKPKFTPDPNSPRPLRPANEPGAPLPTMDDLAHLLDQDPDMAQRIAGGIQESRHLDQFAQSPQLGQLIEQVQQQNPNVDFDTWIAMIRKAQMDRGY